MVKQSTLATRLVGARRDQLELEEAELRVVAGPDRGLTAKLSADSILIGSGVACDLVLTDRTVSSRHAEIVPTERGYVVRDLGSTNGVLCSGTTLVRALLHDGMKLLLGETALVVRSLKARQIIPLAEPGDFGHLVAYSTKMRALVASIERIARSDSTVLIEGETGSGKERVAQTLHGLSDRRTGPFVVFDCSSVRSSLAVAELFGHERGAFTGAERARVGLFAEADGGTLFLDEVGELSAEAQPLLSRAIESKLIRPIGGKERRCDVRVIAATNRNLAEEVRAKRLRADLYHRLAVIKVRVPPLRERPEDIPRLADLFAHEVGITLSPESLVPFLSYEWPGNVRELRNAIARLAAGRDGALVDPDEPEPRLSLPEARRRAVDQLERAYLRRVLAESGGSLSGAAELAGITRQSLTTLVDKHRLLPR
jgi:transcriptional regulator with GAF, ATPase, and Fis domain